jgi:2-dehydro-3-deoxy-D-gluconate 5-dehydrogenase
LLLEKCRSAISRFSFAFTFEFRLIMFDISGKSALITGGTSDIGAAIANQLFAAGCGVLVAGLPEEKPTPNLVDRIEVARLNVSDAESIQRLTAGLERLDILINCAGMIRRSAEIRFRDLRKSDRCQPDRYHALCMACRPLLADRGGSIVNIASMFSFFGSGMSPAALR